MIGPPAISIDSLIWDLICGVGGAGADPPTYKIGKFFLMALALPVTIFNQKYSHTKAEERRKLKTRL